MNYANNGNPTGILILNTGSPDSPEENDVRKYLKEFLSDSAIIDIPYPLRMLLLHLIILPKRPARSALLYRKIWTSHGSPLIYMSGRLADKLEKQLQSMGRNVIVESAMRYGNPSISNALQSFVQKGVKEILAMPNFPQYASATTGSAIVELDRRARDISGELKISILPPFFNRSEYLDSMAKRIRAKLMIIENSGGAKPDYFLFTFHGLPVSHIKKSDISGKCLVSGDCCDDPQAPARNCYRAQCVATARNIGNRLGLHEDHFGFAFQSRMGRSRWIGPHTEEVLKDLSRRGVKNIAVIAPSFAVDCLETLEEIAITGSEIFRRGGGKEFRYIPALNDDSAWVEALAGLIDRQLSNS